MIEDRIRAMKLSIAHAELAEALANWRAERLPGMRAYYRSRVRASILMIRYATGKVQIYAA